MTVKQLRDRLNAILATGVSSETPVLVGSDFDGRRTLVNADVVDIDVISGRDDFRDSVVLYREVV